MYLSSSLSEGTAFVSNSHNDRLINFKKLDIAEYYCCSNLRFYLFVLKGSIIRIHHTKQNELFSILLLLLPALDEYFCKIDW